MRREMFVLWGSRALPSPWISRDEIPKASSLDEIMADPQNRDAYVLLAEIPDARPKGVRVNVTFKED